MQNSDVTQCLHDVFTLKIGMVKEQFLDADPSIDLPTSIPTVTRIPRMQGLSSITAGLMVILSKVSPFTEVTIT